VSILLKLKGSWAAIRWKILIIFTFFSIVSVIMVTSFSVAVLNVVIRRESAYLIEERIKVILESRKGLADAVLSRVHSCKDASDPTLAAVFTEHLNAEWPGSRSTISVLPAGVPPASAFPWMDAQTFAGLVEDPGELEIRFVRTVRGAGCFVRLDVIIPVAESFLSQLSQASGLQIVSSKPVLLNDYRRDEGMAGEIEANFLPGSSRPVPVVVIARNSTTGLSQSWVICQIRPGLGRTIEDLSRMGLRRASWVFPLISIALTLGLAYGCGMYLALRSADASSPSSTL
jgi:hypothetical protein